MDFFSAATRHLEDAEALHDSRRYDNSLYLAGYVVECSLKAVVELYEGDAPKFGHDLLRLERDGLELALAMAPAAVRYRPPPGVVKSVRDVWSEHKRYIPTGQIKKSASEQILEHARQAWTCCIGQMLLDGIVSELR